ncbi:MAG TPA: ABC transporter substrate-binding protein [bacterium (Candidatus Stahlbacteria)]|nr:ABC transporter substrate-binding protein [Candidatus Stahlbacteria bacterium]
MTKRKISILVGLVVIVGVVFVFTYFQKGRVPKHEKDRIQFQLDWKAEIQFAGFFVAREKGFYADENIEVDILEGIGAPTSAKLVGQGKVPLGTCSGAATVIAKAKGIPIKSLAVISQRSPVVIFSLKDSGIEKPQDLIGKRIGLNYNSITYRHYQALINKLNINRTKIKEVGVGWDATPLLTGQVDALIDYTFVNPVNLKVQGKEIIEIPLANYGINPYSTNIIVNEEFLKNNENLVKRFMKSTVKGWEYFIDHPEESIQIFIRTYPERELQVQKVSTPKIIELTQSKEVKKYGFGWQTKARWEETQDLLFGLNLIDRKMDVTTIYTNDFLPLP